MMGIPERDEKEIRQKGYLKKQQLKTSQTWGKN